MKAFVLLILALSACSTSPKLEYPITNKKYKDDTVNVQVAVNLAYSAYLSGCVDRSLLLSKKHVKDNVIFMIDEEVRPKMVHEWC